MAYEPYCKNCLCNLEVCTCQKRIDRVSCPGCAAKDRLIIELDERARKWEKLHDHRTEEFNEQSEELAAKDRQIEELQTEASFDDAEWKKSVAAKDEEISSLKLTINALRLTRDGLAGSAQEVIKSIHARLDEIESASLRKDEEIACLNRDQAARLRWFQDEIDRLKPAEASRPGQAGQLQAHERSGGGSGCCCRGKPVN